MLSLFSLTVHRIFYGKFVDEAVFSDTFLESFREGALYDYEDCIRPHLSDHPREFVERKITMLISNGFLARQSHPFAPDTIKITSAGLIHLASGGYLAQLKQSKNASLTLYVAIATLAVSIATLILSLYHRH
jgi:hypothetical protein